MAKVTDVNMCHSASMTDTGLCYDETQLQQGQVWGIILCMCPANDNVTL